MGLLDGFYELQARALSRLHLAIEPDPMHWFYYDVSLYNGQYYFYWGMLPALMFAGFVKVFGKVVSSYLVVSCFLFSFIYFFQRIIGSIVDNAVRDEESHKSWLKVSSLPLLWLFIFNLPFPANKNTWFFGRFGIYEQQIIFGLAIIMPALFLLIKGIQKYNSSTLCLAVFLCSLAAWTRGSWFVLACLALPVFLFCSALADKDFFRQAVMQRAGLWLIAAAVLLIALLCLNFIRFDSFFDFGLRHQNPTNYDYLRAQNGIFSPATKLWNFAYNLLGYYGAPGLIKYLGLIKKSSSAAEFYPTSFFYFNPQFLPVLVLAPLGVYRAYKKSRELFLWMIGTGLTAVYITMLIAAVGNFVILRYFIEIYFFVLLFFFIVIVALIPYRFAILIMVLLLVVPLPGNIKAFATFTPELRLIAPDNNCTNGPCEKGTPSQQEFFIERTVTWPRESVSIDKIDRFRIYNLIGIAPGADGMLFGEDVAATYIIPGSAGLRDGTKSMLSIKSLTAVGCNGNARFYVDGHYIGNLVVSAKTAIDGQLFFDNKSLRQAPYQILIIFLPENNKSLPAHSSGRPVFRFKEISLLTGASPS